MKDNEIWLAFMVGALATSSGRVAAGHADDALEEYRKRWGKDDEGPEDGRFMSNTGIIEYDN